MKLSDSASDPGVSSEFMSGLAQILFVIFVLCAAVGVIFALYLAFNLARAGDEQTRSKAKKRIVNAIASLMTVVILTVILFSTGAVRLDGIFPEPPLQLPPTADVGDAATHWNLLGIVVREVDFRLPAPRVNDPVRDINITMDAWDIAQARSQLNSLPETLTLLSNNQMTATLTIKEVERWVAPRSADNNDISDFMWSVVTQAWSLGPTLKGDIIYPLIEQNPGQFDHVTVFMRTRCSGQFANIHHPFQGVATQPVSRGGTALMGSSAVFFPPQRRVWHVNDTGWNERTMVHEFLHSMERLAWFNQHMPIMNVIDRPQAFGFSSELNMRGLEALEFYASFMNGRLIESGRGDGYIGLRPETYRKRFTIGRRMWTILDPWPA